MSENDRHVRHKNCSGTRSGNPVAKTRSTDRYRARTLELVDRPLPCQPRYLQLLSWDQKTWVHTDPDRIETGGVGARTLSPSPTVRAVWCSQGQADLVPEDRKSHNEADGADCQ